MLKKGFGLSEMIVGLTVFVIAFSAILSSISTNNASFILKDKETRQVSVYQEIYGYTYSYKKNFGTTMFKNDLLAGMDSTDTNCNRRINSTDVNNYCIFYPIYTAGNLTFVPATSILTGDNNQIYFPSNVAEINDFIAVNRLKTPYKQVYIAIRQDTTVEDTFFVSIGIVDISETFVGGSRIFVNLSQNYELY